MDISCCQVRNSSDKRCIIFQSFTGGHGGKNLGDVLDYDPDADKWTKVGQLAQARQGHGMSLVSKETADYCV